MRPLILVVSCLTVAYGQAADAPSFEVASIKLPSLAHSIGCSGGPGTTDPGTWRCSYVPLAFLISHAYGLQPYQFTPIDSCCQARFDFAAKVPAGATREQFRQMLQNLLGERFKLAFHHERKEVAIYELTVGEKGPRMKESAPDATSPPQDPWSDHPPFIMGKDGYPEFPAGQVGLAGGNGHFRWTGVSLSMPEIARTLAYYLGRPVVDATGLKGKYDINMTWTIDLAWVLESAGMRDRIPDLPDTGPSGPTFIHAVRDQLGLQLISKKGPGDIVVVDHVEKVPIEN